MRKGKAGLLAGLVLVLVAGGFWLGVRRDRDKEAAELAGTELEEVRFFEIGPVEGSKSVFGPFERMDIAGLRVVGVESGGPGEAEVRVGFLREGEARTAVVRVRGYVSLAYQGERRGGLVMAEELGGELEGGERVVVTLVYQAPGSQARAEAMKARMRAYLEKNNPKFAERVEAYVGDLGERRYEAGEVEAGWLEGEELLGVMASSILVLEEEE